MDLVWKVYVRLEAPSIPWSINTTSKCLYLAKSTVAEDSTNLSHCIVLNNTSTGSNIVQAPPSWLFLPKQGVKASHPHIKEAMSSSWYYERAGFQSSCLLFLLAQTGKLNQYTDRPWLDDQRFGVWSLVGQDIFLFSTASKLALGHLTSYPVGTKGSSRGKTVKVWSWSLTSIYYLD